MIPEAREVPVASRSYAGCSLLQRRSLSELRATAIQLVAISKLLTELLNLIDAIDLATIWAIPPESFTRVTGYQQQSFGGAR